MHGGVGLNCAGIIFILAPLSEGYFNELLIRGLDLCFHTLRRV